MNEKGKLQAISDLLEQMKQDNPSPIERIIKSGAVHVAQSGRKQLANAGAVIALLATGKEKALCASTNQSDAQRA